MCEPSTILMAAGTVASMYGQQQQANASSELAGYNAKVAEQQGQDARVRGAAEEQRFRSKVTALQGSQSAAMGASGLDMASQSFEAIQDQTARMGETDALTVRANALREAYGWDQKATSLKLQAVNEQADAQAKMFGTALTGFGSAWKNQKGVDDLMGRLKPKGV